MVSTIREATEEEKGLARTFAEEFKEPFKKLVLSCENEGFRVIFNKDNQKDLPVLMPSGKILCWDFDSRSLDELEGYDTNCDLRDACTYLGLVTKPYLRAQGVKVD